MDKRLGSYEIEKALNKISRDYGLLESDFISTSKKLHASEVENAIYRRIFDGDTPSIFVMRAPHNIATISVQNKKFIVDTENGWNRELDNIKKHDVLLLHHTGMGVGEYIVVDKVEIQGEDKEKQMTIYIKDTIFQRGYISIQDARRLIGNEFKFSGALTPISLEDGLKIIRQIYKNIA